MIDVRRAYFYARKDQAVGSVGLLRESSYGTRDGAQNLECELGGFLEEIGLRRRQASMCLYSEEAQRISASVHGDDVTVKASREDAGWLIRKFKERYEIKTQMIGEAADLDKQLQILNRTVRWSSRGLWMEADPRHVKEVIRALGLEGASPVSTPGVAAKGETRVEDNEDSTEPELGHVPCGRGEAELFVPRPARHHVRHREAVLKDVSAGRTRLEELEETGTVSRWKATSGVSF